jgi:hypothetical protein
MFSVCLSGGSTPGDVMSIWLCPHFVMYVNFTRRASLTHVSGVRREQWF